MSNVQPCALLMNDIHVSKDNISDFNDNWNEALTCCKDHQIYDIIIGGDLWQSRSAQTLDTLLAVRDAIIKAQSADINLTIAEGNHDLVNQEALEGYSHIFQGYKGVDVVDDYMIIDFNDQLSLYVMSYFPENGSFTERLGKIIADESFDTRRTNILYAHQGIKGGLTQPRDVELPTQIFKDFDKVLVGHYHDRKVIANTNIEYIGASRQHNFGEDEEKGYTILNGDGSINFIKNRVNTRYKNISIGISEINSDFEAELKSIKGDPRYKIKVKVSCYSDEVTMIDKQKLIEAGATKVEIVTEQTETVEVESQSLDQKFDKTGIKEEYTNFCAVKEIDNEMGLKYLDMIK